MHNDSLKCIQTILVHSDFIFHAVFDVRFVVVVVAVDKFFFLFIGKGSLRAQGNMRRGRG